MCKDTNKRFMTKTKDRSSEGFECGDGFCCYSERKCFCLIIKSSFTEDLMIKPPYIKSSIQCNYKACPIIKSAPATATEYDTSPSTLQNTKHAHFK